MGGGDWGMEGARGDERLLGQLRQSREGGSLPLGWVVGHAYRWFGRRLSFERHTLAGLCLVHVSLAPWVEPAAILLLVLTISPS